MPSVEIIYRYDTEAMRARARPSGMEEARARLEAGNLRFATLLDSLAHGEPGLRHEIRIDARDVGVLGAGDAPAQRPYAAILGCSDARVPLELLFGEGPNDLFVVRIAGNVLGGEVVGSLRYAANQLGGLSTAVVLGHSGCGAVGTAVDLFLGPAGLFALATDHALRGLLERIFLVVEIAARSLERVHGPGVRARPGFRAALNEVAIALNAAAGAFVLSQDLAPLPVLFGVYVVGARRVRVPDTGSGEVDGLAPPPSDPEGFRAIFDRFARAERIVLLLDAAQPCAH